MSTKELEVINQGPESYQFASSFDGTRYYILLNYNNRNDVFYVTVKDADLETLLAGIPCFTNVQGLTFRFKLPGLFPFGDLIVGDANETALDPTYEIFGDNVSLFYLSLVS